MITKQGWNYLVDSKEERLIYCKNDKIDEKSQLISDNCLINYYIIIAQLTSSTLRNLDAIINPFFKNIFEQFVAANVSLKCLLCQENDIPELLSQKFW